MTKPLTLATIAAALVFACGTQDSGTKLAPSPSPTPSAADYSVPEASSIPTPTTQTDTGTSTTSTTSSSTATDTSSSTTSTSLNSLQYTYSSTDPTQADWKDDDVISEIESIQLCQKLSGIPGDLISKYASCVVPYGGGKRCTISHWNWKKNDGWFYSFTIDRDSNGIVDNIYNGGTGESTWRHCETSTSSTTETSTSIGTATALSSNTSTGVSAELQKCLDDVQAEAHQMVVNAFTQVDKMNAEQNAINFTSGGELECHAKYGN